MRGFFGIKPSRFLPRLRLPHTPHHGMRQTLPRQLPPRAPTIDPPPSRRQLSRSTRGSFSVSSQRKVFPARKHSPDNPEFTSSRVPSAGALSPTLARHITPPLCTSAIAALVPRVSDRARSPINLSDAVRSVPRELNSYCTVADAGT